MIIPVILCGGIGTRLWPLSRQSYPKQLFPLLAPAESLLQQTVLRLNLIPHLSPPILLCQEDHRFAILDQMAKIGLMERKMILEPFPKNTAPAVTIAALSVDKQDLLWIIPSDQALSNHAEMLQKAILDAAHIAKMGYLVTFGISPECPHTGYGYIKQGQAMLQTAGYRVTQFVEKPDADQAKAYFEANGYYWNSGWFLFSAATCLAEMTQFSPHIVSACRQAWSLSKQDKQFIYVDREAFSQCESNSIDYAVIQHSKRVVMIPLENSGWSDLGTWDAIYTAKDKDENNNVLCGEVYTHQVSECYIHAETRLVAAVGVQEHIIVETADAVLVAHKESSQEIKALVKQLADCKRGEIIDHRRVHRPWGYYEILDRASDVQVKRIIVRPGACLSLQKHQFRAEHWIVVSGIATVICGEKQFILTKNESTHIPIATFHRLQNDTIEPLIIIEVQTGDYLGEDDIMRVEDIYGRN